MWLLAEKTYDQAGFSLKYLDSHRLRPTNQFITNEKPPSKALLLIKLQNFFDARQCHCE